MNRIVIVFLALVFIQVSCLQAQEPATVQWLTIEEAVAKMEVEKRKIFIDMYTDWCGWCKKMDKATFEQPHIATYLNENYYPVKFNAEFKEEISYNGKTYKFIKSGRRGYHELAAELSKSLGRLSFPTIIFVDSDLTVLQPHPRLPGSQKIRSDHDLLCRRSLPECSLEKISRHLLPDK